MKEWIKNLKPGDKIRINKKPTQWASGGRTGIKNPITSHITYPTTIEVKDAKIGIFDSSYYSILCKNGYGWLIQDNSDMELISSKIMSYEIY